MTRRCILVAIGVALLLASLPRSWPGLREWRLDGWSGLLTGLLVGEDTVYAGGYSASSFGEITAGMQRTEVHELAGPPLGGRMAADGRLGWDLAERWSRSPGDTHYRRRAVFYRRGQVVEVVGEFYFD